MEDIDHVYLSKGVSVTNWITVSAAKAGSDHVVEIFDVTMPGSGGGEADIIKSLGIKKVLVVVEENHSLDQMKQGMPYTFSLAKQYGYTTNYTAITHPSLPNYIAMAAGSTMGVTDDKEPSEHKLQGQSVFGQAISSGKTAKIYAESMSGNCDTTSGGKYLARHNPWAYFVDERSLCKQYDVPATQFQADVTAGTLPNVGMIIPNRCNDAHDCSLATADNWFKGQMNTIMSGPDWKLGNLLVVLTADEDDKKSNNTVLTVLLNPNISSAVADAALSHYSLSQLLSSVSGNAGLRDAKSASPITVPSSAIQKVASP
jgi:acid phosphatase